MRFFGARNPKHLSLALLAAVLSAGLCQAQTASWALASSGFVYDAPGRSVRPIVGLVGSSTLGPSTVDSVDWATMTPDQMSAIVRVNGSQSWLSDLNNPGQRQALDALPALQAAIWASDATRAVVLSQDSQLMWLSASSLSAGSYAGSAPAAQALGKLVPPDANGNPAVWSLLAADSNADRVLLSVASGGASQLWTASSTAAASLTAFSGNATAAVFAAKSSMVFVADTSAHQIDQVQGLDGSPSFAPLPISGGLVGDTTGLVLSADESRLFIVDRAGRTVHIVQPAAGNVIADLTTFFFPGSVTVVSPGRFLLNSAPDPAAPVVSSPVASSSDSLPPLYFLMTDDPARVLFVPRVN